MVFTDQMQRKIELVVTPRRIVSLVPSQTELLFDLGLRDEVVGITKFCVRPNEWYTSKVRVGGTKDIDIEKIKSLNPDLIIGNKEENEREQIEELMKLYPVWMSDITTLKDAYDMITRVGTLVGKQQEAMLLKLQIEAKMDVFVNIRNKPAKNKVAYFIWKKPYMVAGSHTFIDEMLIMCHLTNVFADKGSSRYPEITAQQLADANPQLILLSSEPYPFKEKHIQEFKAICPAANVLIVDGELFSWYGSRLLQAPDYFDKLIQLMV